MVQAISLAPWAIAYAIPLACFAWWLVLRGRSLWDPVLLGGGFLGLMFLLRLPGDSAVPVSRLWLLHAGCAAAYWAGCFFGHWWSGRRASERWLQRPLLVAHPATYWVLVSLLCVLGLFILVVHYRASLELVLKMRSRPDLELGSLTAPLGMWERLAQYCKGYLGPLGLLSVYFLCRRPRAGPVAVTLLAVGLALWGLVAVAGGSRGAVLFLLIYCWMGARYARNGNELLRRVLGWVLAATVPVMVMVMLVQTLYRYTGVPLETVRQDLDRRLEEAVREFARSVSFNDEVEFVLSTYPRHFPYTHGYSLLTPWVVFVPRTAWPGKPVPWGRQFAWQRGFRYGTTVSLAATVAGEGWANFGPAGWLFLPWIFGLAIGACRFRLKSGWDDFDLMVGLWGICWVHSLRGDLHSAVVSILMPYWIVMLALRLLAFRPLQSAESGFLPALEPSPVAAWD